MTISLYLLICTIYTAIRWEIIIYLGTEERPTREDNALLAWLGASITVVMYILLAPIYFFMDMSVVVNALCKEE